MKRLPPDFRSRRNRSDVRPYRPAENTGVEANPENKRNDDAARDPAKKQEQLLSNKFVIAKPLPIMERNHDKTAGDDNGHEQSHARSDWEQSKRASLLNKRGEKRG